METMTRIDQEAYEYVRELFFLGLITATQFEEMETLYLLGKRSAYIENKRRDGK